MKIIRAFIMGVREFRSDLTLSYDDDRLDDAYDRGRDLAHRLTRRRYDASSTPPYGGR